MSRERWFREGDKAAGFDWQRAARELAVDEELARALYHRALRLAADARHAEQLYLRWLRAAAQTQPAASATVAVPGRQTRLADGTARGAQLAADERRVPGKWTRVLLESMSDDERAAQPPGLDEVRGALLALSGRTGEPSDGDLGVRSPLAGGEHEAGGAGVASTASTLREQLVEAVASGHRTVELLAAVAPEVATAALRELTSVGSPGDGPAALPRLARASGGEVARLFGRSSAGAALPGEVAARLAPHVGAGATAAAHIHTDDAAHDLAAAHHAHAVTLGNAIYFARGAYRPGTAGGDELLAHELTHVAQGQRGELTRAAAKGIDSGDALDPAEAEADLRARLAVLALHAPDAAPPALAAPSGQPTSDGDRAARLAAQQQRLTQAGQDAPAEAIDPVAPTWSPGAPVAHSPPVMASAPAPAARPNAYVTTFAAPPSRQALELWAKAGSDATTQAAAEQTAFAATVQQLPVALAGSDVTAGDGGGPAGGGAVPATSPAAGAAPPGVQPTPTPAPPPASGAVAVVAAVAPGADPAQQQTDAKQAIAALPTTLPDGLTDPGTAPVTELAGQADPMRSVADREHAAGEGARAFDAAKQQLIAGPGAARVQPVKLDEKLDVPRPQAGAAMPELQPVDGMAKLKKWNLPAAAQASFDELARPKLDASLAAAKTSMTAADVRRDADRARAVDDAHTKVAQAHADADRQQQTKVAETRTQIANHQADTLVKHEAEVRKLDKLAGDKKSTTLGNINTRLAADQAKVDADYKAAQKSAEDQKAKGEADVAKKKQDAQDKANNQSWWDQLVGAICDAIKAIADEIDQALDAVGQAIGGILDAVKTAACHVIDAARDFVCQALTELSDWLKDAITALIGSVFPELAAALNALIDTAVAAAKAAVTAIADGLKAAVKALCDGLKAALDAAIAAFQAAVQAAATLAQAAMTGDWKLVGQMVLEGVLKALGIDPAAFYALVGKAEDAIEKIVADPGAFVGHLIDAIKLGFSQFGTNFAVHLKDGLVQWLFGTFAQAGIRMPATFDLAGIFDLVAQVLGLTWPRLRSKAVNLIGEQNTRRLEKVAGYLQALVTGGFAGLWAKVQQDLGQLWNMVVGGVEQWLMQNVVQAAIVKIVTLWNPAGAIFELLQTAWNAYQWLRANAQRIFGLVQAVVDSISSIAAGNIAGAANFIEASLAKLVPIAISLFADLIGLGGIGEALRGVIAGVQATVDQAIDSLIERVMAMFKDDGDAPPDGDAAPPEVPRSLVEPAPVTLDEVTPGLAAAVAQADSGAVLYQAGTTDPAQVTQALLADHADAQLDPETRQLTLPAVAESALAVAPSLQALGQAIAEATGVSKVTLTKADGKAELHGHINPETVIARLAAGTLDDDDRAQLLAMLQRIADEFWKTHLGRGRKPGRDAHADDMQRMARDGQGGGYLPSRPADDLRLAAAQASQKDPGAAQDVVHGPLAPGGTSSVVTRESRGGLTRVVGDDGTLSDGLTYDEIVARLGAEHSPQAVARALDTLRTGGGIDPEFTAQADELAVLRNLMFNVEVQRDRRNLVFSPMATDLMAAGTPMDQVLGTDDGLHPATMELAAAGASPPGKPFFGTTYSSLGATNEERDQRLQELRAENQRRQIALLTTWFQAALEAGAAPADGTLEELEAFVRGWVEAHYLRAVNEAGGEPTPDDDQDDA